MPNQLVSNETKQEKDTSITLKDYRKHALTIVQKMKICEAKATSKKDEKNAQNQLNFLEDIVKNMDILLKLPSTNISTRKSVGAKMSSMPKKYFGIKSIPLIEGEKSKAFAKLLTEHFKDFTKVKFSERDVQASIFAAKIPFLNIRSIPDEIKHHAKIIEEIEKNIEKYNIKMCHKSSYRA